MRTSIEEVSRIADMAVKVAASTMLEKLNKLIEGGELVVEKLEGTVILLPNSTEVTYGIECNMKVATFDSKEELQAENEKLKAAIKILCEVNKQQEVRYGK